MKMTNEQATWLWNSLRESQTDLGVVMRFLRLPIVGPPDDADRFTAGSFLRQFAGAIESSLADVALPQTPR